MLQQCLPLAVLKLLRVGIRLSSHSPVATVLTACGIETIEIYRHLIWKLLTGCNSAYRLRYWNANKSTVYPMFYTVATVLTACGIETLFSFATYDCRLVVATVLTACGIETINTFLIEAFVLDLVATVLTACGIETLHPNVLQTRPHQTSCNSAYRLRYWNTPLLPEARINKPVATVLTACGIET